MPAGLVGVDLDRLASVLALPEVRGLQVFRMQPAQFHAGTRHARYNCFVFLQQRVKTILFRKGMEEILFAGN